MFRVEDSKQGQGQTQNTISSDDYRTRIEPYYNGQGLVTQGKNKCVVLQHITNQGSKDSHKDYKII